MSPNQLGVRPAGGKSANDFLFPILLVDTSCHDLREDVLIDVNLRQDFHLLFFLWFWTPHDLGFDRSAHGRKRQ